MLRVRHGIRYPARKLLKVDDARVFRVENVQERSQYLRRMWPVLRGMCASTRRARRLRRSHSVSCSHASIRSVVCSAYYTHTHTLSLFLIFGTLHQGDEVAPLSYLHPSCILVSIPRSPVRGSACTTYSVHPVSILLSCHGIREGRQVMEWLRNICVSFVVLSPRMCCDHPSAPAQRCCRLPFPVVRHYPYS